jgi:hypothetical protein
VPTRIEAHGVGDGSWRDQWENAATSELDRFRTMPLEDLLDRLERRKFGDYHVIWDAVAERNDLARAAWVLYDIVRSPADYLDRYHAARALLALLRVMPYEPADLTVAHRHPEPALAAVEAMLTREIGPRGGR